MAPRNLVAEQFGNVMSYADIGAPVLGAVLGAYVAGPRRRWAGVGVGLVAGYLVGSYYTASTGLGRVLAAGDDVDELIRLRGG